MRILLTARRPGSDRRIAALCAVLLCRAQLRLHRLRLPLWRRGGGAGRIRRLAIPIQMATVIVALPAMAIGALLGVAREGHVWRIDESTGAIARVGSTGHTGESALAVDSSGTVYSLVGIAGEGAFLETIDPATGTGTLGTHLQQPAGGQGLALSSDDVLYGTATGASSLDLTELFRIDVATGAVTKIGSIGSWKVLALDFGPDSALYGMAGNTLGTIDLATVQFSPIRTFANVPDVASFVFLPDGRIVGGTYSATLVEMDPASGTSREIAPLAETLFGLAFLPDLPPPPPTTSQGPRTAFRVAAFDGDWRSPFVTIGDVAYFETNDGAGANTLWRTDGTTNGTQIVKQVTPLGFFGSGLVMMNDTLFFYAYEPATGYEPWKSDGTTLGTQLVKDIVPGPDPTFSIADGVLGSVDGKLFLVTDFLLYVSDGTAAGTQLVPPGFSPTGPVIGAAGLLFFNAEDPPTYTVYLYRTDGTQAGTSRVGPPMSLSAEVDGGLVVYVSGAQLLATDGTAVRLVKDFHPDPEDGHEVDVRSLTNVGETLYFVVTDFFCSGTCSPDLDTELWKTDGTPDGTQLVQHSVGRREWVPRAFAGTDGTVFFAAGDATHGRELWKTDGSEAGTQLLKDIRPGAEDSDPSSLAEVGGQIVFSACDDVAGCEPWATTPDHLGAVRVADIVPGPVPSNPTDFTRLGDLVLFRVRPNGYRANWELWAIPISTLSLQCNDGLDNDSDGLADLDDPGCPFFEATLEDPPCDDGADNDGDGLVDFDDPVCTAHWPYWEAAPPLSAYQPPPMCGVGAELALVMGLLARVRRRRSRRGAR